MTTPANEQFVRNTFEQSRGRLGRLAGRLTEDPDAVVDEAAVLFDEMIPGMAYVDKPDNQMASALFICSINLALYLALKARGVDVHDFGNAMLTGLAKAPATPPPDLTTPENLAGFKAGADASQQSAAPGEFVYEAHTGNDGDLDWGMNIKSCAICHQYTKYDAMDLVPYMCATDDVESDKNSLGLRRTGSIAVGAHQCDFRYKAGGEPQRLAAQYPDKIRLVAQE
jgi:hypothetical protein